MGLNCGCPLGASLPDLKSSNCPESLGQVQKVVFQRIKKDATTKNAFVIASANPNLKASWTPFVTATDGTKITVSPYIESPATEPGAARTFGGGNATLGGIPIVIGREPTSFTGMIMQQPQAVIAALKAYQCETAVAMNTGVYLIDENGAIAGLVDNHETPTKFMPIPIRGLFVGDKKLGGLEEVDSNAISFNLDPNWSDMLYIVKPTDFNPLTDLVKP